MALTSEELNYLLYRYLLESGYTHTAFTFANESLVKQAGINGADVPPGALISFVQKGMLYSNIEQHVNDDGTIMDDGDDDKLASLLLPGHLQSRENEDKDDGADAMDEDGMEVESSKITTLAGHENEVFTVAWNPVKSLLASGSGDSSARIWHIPTAESGAEAERNTQWHVLEHYNSSSNEKAKDVTTLDWNTDGSLLATGSYDGHARIWNEQVCVLICAVCAERGLCAVCCAGPLFLSREHWRRARGGGRIGMRPGQENIRMWSSPEAAGTEQPVQSSRVCGHA